MAHESFEDQEVAEILNKDYISIKVDREERPDVDHVYMTVCQALTGSGGWPLTVIMTPDRKPFFAGTYYPKRGRMESQGLIEILEKVDELWKNKRETLVSSSDTLTGVLRHQAQTSDPLGHLDPELIRDLLDDAFEDITDIFDEKYGGFGKAPKFPTPHKIFFLLRHYKMTGDTRSIDMVNKTLEDMYRGGIYDHIGYGFARYSTDNKWLVPHFEKMLYDNALLAIAYLEAYQVIGKELYKKAAESIFSYVLRDMTDPQGGFYSAEDADSEGVEGKFYVWTTDELRQVLGDKADEYISTYNITSKGNFEGGNIPNLINYDGNPIDAAILTSEQRQKLFEYRNKRIRPHKDDKILTSWNGMMIAAFSLGCKVLGKEEYKAAAEKAVSFIFNNMTVGENKLLARYRDGQAAFSGYLDDYAYMVWGLIELYEATYKPVYLRKAINLTLKMLEDFSDEESGGFYLNSRDAEQLIVRPRETYDGATPAGNSVAALDLLRLARLTGRQEFEEKADKLLASFIPEAAKYPPGHVFLLSALLFKANKGREVVIAGSREDESTKNMLQAVNKSFQPFTVVIYKPSYEDTSDLVRMIPFLEEHNPIQGETTAYVCENYSCRAPVVTVEELDNLLH